MSSPRKLVTLFGLFAMCMFLFGVRGNCGQASAKSRVSSEKTIEVKPGTTRLDTKVGEMDFTRARIEVSPPSNGMIRIRLKVAGSNDSHHDHDAQVKATLVGDSDVVIETATKKREIEEGEHDKELSFDFHVTPEQMASALRFKLTLTYIP
jgi:hypothetical protein